MPLSTKVNHIKAVKCWSFLEAESESQWAQQGPSVALDSAGWSLVSADTKADGSVASLVAILVSNNNQWIPAGILSSLHLNIYHR